MKSYKYIVVEGNIGAGKTSLASMLALKYSADLLLEEFEDNSFLPGFYKDPDKYAFPLELSFMADRYHQINASSFNRTVVADYHFLKSRAFAGHTLNADEYNLFVKMSDIMLPKVPQVDLLIYLKRNTKSLLSNIKNRGRSYVQDISEDYLLKVEYSYVNLLKSLKDTTVLIVDCEGLDFVNNTGDYRAFLELIEQNHLQGVTQITMK